MRLKCAFKQTYLLAAAAWRAHTEHYSTLSEIQRIDIEQVVPQGCSELPVHCCLAHVNNILDQELIFFFYRHSSCCCSSPCSCWDKVLPLGEWTQNVFGAYAAAAVNSWSTVHSYLLIRDTLPEAHGLSRRSREARHRWSVARQTVCLICHFINTVVFYRFRARFHQTALSSPAKHVKYVLLYCLFYFQR